MTFSDDGRAFPDAERDKCSAVSMVWTQADTHRATVRAWPGSARSPICEAQNQLFDNPPHGLRVVL